MKLMDEFPLTITGLLLTVLFASVFSTILPMVLGPVYSAIGFQTIIGGVIALILMLVIASETVFDEVPIFDIIVLFVGVGLVGSVIITAFPAAAPYIISVESFTNLTSIAWSFVYIGLGLMAKKFVPI